MKNTIIIICIGILSASCANDSYYKNGKLTTLKSTSKSRSLSGSNIEYYSNQKGQEIGVINEVLLECKDNINCDTLLSSLNLKNYSKLTNKIFLVKVENNDDAFSTSRKLFESGSVKYAHPNFIKKRTKR